jgi:hypothetical protein
VPPTCLVLDVSSHRVEQLSYAEFGAAFVAQAVSAERVAEVLARITGDSITVGPLAAGPGGAARATCLGTLAPPVLRRTGAEPLTYDVRLPVTVALSVDVAGSTHRYDGTLEVRFAIEVRTEAPLTLVVVPARVTARDVTCDLAAKGLRAKAVAAIGDLDGEVRREVADYVNARMEGEDAAAVTRIDLVPVIESAWAAGLI